MGKQLRYIRIADDLRSRIQAGAFPPGSPLPSHRELAEQFSTSMMTTRQALHVLAAEGLVSIVHGRGTYAGSQTAHGYTLRLPGFQHEMAGHRVGIQTRVLARDYAVKNPRLSRLFHKKGDFCRLTRLRLLADKPIILQRSYTLASYRRVIEEYRDHLSLYQSFSESTGQLITRGQEIVEPVVVDGEDGALLGLTAPTPAFRSSRLSFSLGGQALIFDEAYLLSTDCYLASGKQGHSTLFSYVIKADGTKDVFACLDDPDLWKELV